MKGDNCRNMFEATSTERSCCIAMDETSVHWKWEYLPFMCSFILMDFRLDHFGLAAFQRKAINVMASRLCKSFNTKSISVWQKHKNIVNSKPKNKTHTSNVCNDKFDSLFLFRPRLQIHWMRNEIEMHAVCVCVCRWMKNERTGDILLPSNTKRNEKMAK